MGRILLRPGFIWLIRVITISASIVALFVIVQTGNWVTAAAGRKVLSRAAATEDLWFSSSQELFVLERAGAGRFLLKKWNISDQDKYADIYSIDVTSLPRIGTTSEEGAQSGHPLFTISRDGSRIAWIADGQLCAAPARDFNGSSCETFIDLASWDKARSLSFFGRSSSVLAVIYENGRLRTFDMQEGERENNRRPGSMFSGPWILRSQGDSIVALPIQKNGNLACIEMIGGKIYPYVPYLAPLVVTAISAQNCKNIAIGTEDGQVLPLSRDKISEPSDLFGVLEGAVRAVAITDDGAVFAAGDFEGIYELRKGSSARKIVESVGVRSLDAGNGHLLYLSSVPTLVTLGREWQPNSWNSFLFNVAVLIAGTLGFVYTIITEIRNKN